MSAGEILEQIRKLPKDEQLTVFEHLREELEPDSDGLTLRESAELERRIKEHKINPNDVVPWEEVRAKAEARLSAKK